MASLKGDGMAIIMVFIGLIIAATFIIPIADSVIGQTATVDVFNSSVTVPANNGTVDLTGRTLVGTATVFNGTNGTASPEALEGKNITIRTAIGSAGLQTVQLFVNDTGEQYVGSVVNVTYTYEPDGYLQNSGARSLANLIILFAALAMVVFAIVVFIKRGSLGALIGK